MSRAGFWSSREDSLFHQAAVNVDANVFVAHDLDDAKRSSMPAMAFEEHFGWLKERHGLSYGEIGFQPGSLRYNI